MAEHLNPSTWPLRCTAGHMHYSPNPKYWVGMSCGKPKSTGDIKQRCKKPMRMA